MTTATTTLKTEYLMTLHSPGSGMPHQIDNSLAIYHQGADGWAKGPKISGTILQPTGDWLRIMPGGSFRVDARMVVKTDDGALIYVTYGGVISVSKENFGRMVSGGTLTSDDMYFVTTPSFQTAHPDYAWLNHVQAVGKVAAVKGGGGDGFVTYEVFAIR